LGESHGFDHGFPLIRSPRASVQPSTSVLFSFLRSFDCGRIFRHAPIKSDSGPVRSSDVVAVRRTKTPESQRVKHWETIANNLSNAGWSWGCVSAVDSKGRTIWIVDAYRDDGSHFVVHADEKLTAFPEAERAIHQFAVSLLS
jgi:hypothetical protein